MTPKEKRSIMARCPITLLLLIARTSTSASGLQKDGFELVFKEIVERADSKPKGNVDAELVLQAMIDFNQYEKAVIVTSDGDFACLVKHLDEKQKLERVLSPDREGCSALLKKAARGRIRFLEDERGKIEYLKKTEGAPGLS